MRGEEEKKGEKERRKGGKKGIKSQKKEVDAHLLPLRSLHFF